MFLRPLIHTTKIINNFNHVGVLNKTINQKTNYSSYGASKPEGDPKLYTECEITRNPEEWKYVEWYLPKTLIPEPPLKQHYPSGWKPITVNPENVPYCVERTKNHMIPVYLDISHRGQCRITKLRRISGDIWKLKEELVNYLRNLNKKPVGIQVDEVAGVLKFRGDHVVDIRNWLLERGF